jgi:hypothetical protein
MATGRTRNRQDFIRHGKRLEYFTIAYNSAEGLVSIIAGIVAGSVSLIGFGLDSLIEVTSGRRCCGDCTRISTNPAENRLSARPCESSVGASSHWRHTSFTNPGPP